MAAERVTCRHCGELFSLKPGKAGYRDECPECLYERSARLQAKSDKRSSGADFDAMKWIRRFTNGFVAAGLSMSEAEAKARRIDEDVLTEAAKAAQVELRR